MEWVIIWFLGLSLLLYCLLGGADFGAGVIEFLIPKEFRARYQELIMKAMGPVWEANHIWLIILIVILFNGFPKFYAEISIYFHIPLTLMLIGIIFRGSAFTFRHYDPIQDRSRELYTLAFSSSSALTPIMFGMIIGGLMLGWVDPKEVSYYAKYIRPWFNLFSFSAGLFVLNIFVFLASVFLIGETKESNEIEYFVAQSRKASLWMIGLGALVFLCAHLNGLPLLSLFLNHRVSLTCFILATATSLVLWRILTISRPWLLRVVAGFQLSMILGAWCGMIYPNLLYYKQGATLTLWNTIGPPKTVSLLGWALILGTFFFLPALMYLLQVFKVRKNEEGPRESK